MACLIFSTIPCYCLCACFLSWFCWLGMNWQYAGHQIHARGSTQNYNCSNHNAVNFPEGCHITSAFHMMNVKCILVWSLKSDKVYFQWQSRDSRWLGPSIGEDFVCTVPFEEGGENIWLAPPNNPNRIWEAVVLLLSDLCDLLQSRYKLITGVGR